jgi:hypothetical protein
MLILRAKMFKKIYVNFLESRSQNPEARIIQAAQIPSTGFWLLDSEF